MFVGGPSKPLLLILCAASLPLGLLFFAESLHVHEARHAPIVEGDIVSRHATQSWGIPATMLVIRIRGSDTLVRAEVARTLGESVEGPVRFHYTGDPEREVHLECEEDPRPIVAVFWGLPLLLVLIYAAMRGKWLLPRGDATPLRRSPEYWCGRRELHPSRWGNLGFSAAGLAMVGVGLLAWNQGRLIAAILVVAGLFTAVFMALQALPRFSGITLLREGFEIRGFLGVDRFSWDDVIAFVHVDDQQQISVGFLLSEDYAGRYPEHELGQRRLGVDGMLPSIHRMTPDELLETMLDWWTMYRSHEKPDPELLDA